MELIPSVSRSRGLQKDGAELIKDSVQRDYWKFLQTKLAGYYLEYPISSHISGSPTGSQRNAQSNILILFRKLREGIMASQRYDDFALDVYETSFYLSILFRLNSQTVSIGSLLVPHGGSQKCFYELHGEPDRSRDGSGSNLPVKGQQQTYYPSSVRKAGVSHTVSIEPAARNFDSSIASTSLLYLLNTLTNFYPLQAPFHAKLRSIRYSHGRCDKDIMLRIFTWSQSIASALLALNYVRLEKLTRLAVVKVLPGFSEIQTAAERTAEAYNLRFVALQCLLEDLRHKFQQTIWQSLRFAYRELDTSFSAEWIQRTLLLRGGCRGVSADVEKWLSERGEGEVQKKMGVEGRWVLRR